MLCEVMLFSLLFVYLLLFFTHCGPVKMDKSAEFYDKLKIDREICNPSGVSMVKSKYDYLIQKVVTIKAKTQKEGSEYKFLKRYDVQEVNGVSKLVCPVNDLNPRVRYFVYDEQLFYILQETYVSGYGSRVQMTKYLKAKYHNVTYKDVQLFLSLYEHRPSKSKPKRQHNDIDVAVKPEMLQDLNSRCQIDIVDFQSQPDGEYHFVMIYQDFITRFVVLKPLKSKTAEEVCDKIIDIFTLFGAPSVLESNHGKDFVQKIRHSLKEFWPNFKIVLGKPRALDPAIERIKHMIRSWMYDKKTAHWSQGLRYVQLLRNCSFHNGINKTPFEAMFGCAPKHGLASANLLLKALHNNNAEEQLENVVETIHVCTEIEEEEEERVEEAGLMERSVLNELGLIVSEPSTLNDKSSEEPFTVGNGFETLIDMEMAIIEYSKQNFVKFYKRDCMTLKSAERTKPKRVASANKNLLYYYVTYACVAGGREHRTQSLGKRRSSTLRDGCEMRVKFLLSPDGQSLVVAEYIKEHNHEINGDERLNQEYRDPSVVSDTMLEDVALDHNYYTLV